MTATIQGRTYEIPEMWVASFTLGGRSVEDAVEQWHEQASQDEWRELADEQQDALPCRDGMRHEWKASCRTYSGYGYRREVGIELRDWFMPADSGTHGKTFTCEHCRQAVFVGTARGGRITANVSPYAKRNAKEAKRETVPATFRFTRTCRQDEHLRPDVARKLDKLATMGVSAIQQAEG